MQQRAAATNEPAGFVDLSFLLAASSAWQAASPTARAVASVRQDLSGSSDRLSALAHIFAPAAGAAPSFSNLAGSFNILISEHLMVGRER
ncbi:hypothetical protein BH10PSE12_BH10PSE12_09800 [soil metagenome]